jgi:hypothetical protein
MRARPSTIILTLGLLVAACSNTITPSRTGTVGSDSPSADQSPSSAAVSASPVAGGCASTQMFAGPGPDAALGLESNAWARATPPDAGIVAYFWYPPPGVVFVSHSADDAPKVLWVSHDARLDPLTISGHPASSVAPSVEFKIPEALAPAGHYPSGIELPEPGCWHFKLAIGDTRAEMDLLVAPTP